MAEYSLTRSRAFAAQHPDCDESIRRAHAEGHTLADESRDHLLRNDRGDVAYWLSLPQNRLERDRLHGLSRKPKEQIAELDKIAAKLDRERPFETNVDNRLDTDKQLAQRRQDILSGKRRR